MIFTVKAYNIHTGLFAIVEKDVVEIEVYATEENEAIGKARKLIREKQCFEVIKITER
jgi:hypothetical protein